MPHGKGKEEKYIKPEKGTYYGYWINGKKNGYFKIELSGIASFENTLIECEYKNDKINGLYSEYWQ